MQQHFIVVKREGFRGELDVGQSIASVGREEDFENQRIVSDEFLRRGGEGEIWFQRGDGGER